MALGRFASIRFTCKKCGGLKMVGDDYYALGETWVDITCIKCSHSKDITVKELDLLLLKMNKAIPKKDQDVNDKTNSE